MIKHPCEGMTRAQIAAFEAIAINRPPNCSKATIEKLLARGLIASQKWNVRFNDGPPPFVVDDYFVPLPIHYQWCEWASEKFRGKL